MKLCVPVTAEGRLDPRWGRAARVAVATVEGGDIKDWSEFDVGWNVLHDEGTEGSHHARVASFLRDHQIELVLVDHVGDGMRRMLDSMGIRIEAPASPDARASAARVSA